MLNIKIIVLGKLKESYWKDAEAEYFKRLGPYAKIEIVALKEEAFRKGDDREKIKKVEAEKILSHVAPQDFFVALHEHGKELTSIELSKFLEKESESGKQIIIAVGGPLGLHDDVLERSNVQLSLSKLTFPHQMVRTILLEQLYRSVTISKGKQYHY